MKRSLCATIAWAVAILCAGRAWALPPVFRDISQQSPSKQYKVEAKSPDKPPDDMALGFGRSRSNFVYTCSELRGEKILWTRKQPAKEEAPPIELFVSDAGWTVIRTYLDDLICVDPKGTDRGKVEVVSAFT